MEHVRKKFLTDIKRLILLVLTAVKIPQEKTLLYAKVNHHIFPRQNNGFFNPYQMM